MTNTSATGGPLLPNPTPAPQPLEDDALDGFFQQLVVGLTGLDGTLVRPRWQAVPPNMPSISTTWVAIGVQLSQADTFAWEGHTPSATGAPNGADVLQRQETLDVLGSFYGPGAGNAGKLVKDGLAIAQNREKLQLAGMGLLEVGDLKAVPALINQQWYRRFDMLIRVNRTIVRTYPVLNILSAEGTITSEGSIEDLVSTFNVNP